MKKGNDLWNCSVMLHKPFPKGDSEEEKKQARTLCMKDSLLAALVITLILMVIDQAAQDISPWWWYLLLCAVLYMAECMVNWRRYKAQLPKKQEKTET